MNNKMKTIIIALIAFSVLFTAVLVAQDDNFALARKAYQRKDWDGVLRYSRLVVEEFPEWFWGYYLLGKGYFNKDDYDGAIRSMSKAVDFSENADDSFRAKFALAEAYYRKRDFDNALRWIASAERHKSSKYYGKSADVIAGMKGFSYFNTQKWRDAINAFKPLVDSGDASADILRAVALSYQNIGQDSNAINIISQVVRKDSSDVDAHRILIKSYLNSGKWREAINAANLALQQHDRDWEIHYFKGRAHHQLRQYSSAEAALRRSIAIAAQDKVRKQLGDSLMAQGKYKEAAEEFGRAQKSYSKDAKFYFNIAYSWTEYVPKDAENYNGKQPQERNFMAALQNAQTMLDNAKNLGLERDKAAGLQEVINNKKERLEKGKFVKIEVEYVINEDTGEVERRVVDDKKDQ